jgi:PD-(D/E)XK nuclease superfamily protein
MGVGIMSEVSIVLPYLTGLWEGAVRKPRGPNPKRMGEVSEAAFQLKAMSLGFEATRPFGDSARYDFILDTGGRLWRVQLKSTSVLHGRGYEVQPTFSVYKDAYGRGKEGYSADDIDLLVVHVRPLDVWYVLPVEAFMPAKCLRFYPDIVCKAARWEGFREAWAVGA